MDTQITAKGVNQPNHRTCPSSNTASTAREVSGRTRRTLSAAQHATARQVWKRVSMTEEVLNGQVRTDGTNQSTAQIMSMASACSRLQDLTRASTERGDRTRSEEHTSELQSRFD